MKILHTEVNLIIQFIVVQDGQNINIVKIPENGRKNVWVTLTYEEKGITLIVKSCLGIF